MEIIPFEHMDYTDDTVCIDECSIEYVQSNDCTEEDGAQALTISCRNNGVDRFINIKTGQEGWSINSTDDLVKLIEDFKKRVSM